MVIVVAFTRMIPAGLGAPRGPAPLATAAFSGLLPHHSGSTWPSRAVFWWLWLRCLHRPWRRQQLAPARPVARGFCRAVVSLCASLVSGARLFPWDYPLLFMISTLLLVTGLLLLYCR